ncbi:MAG TPA: hypothetical protein VJ653_07970 [Acidimicrobiales bacterium]|nr:hypothetical protein [Acidimicrobiales bacterium]
MTRRVPKLESLFVATFALLGFRLGVRPISDNSMLTHLRTGIDMVRGGGIPREDPYSWTAKGEPWVVQSWLPEWTYGWAYRLGGFRLVVLEQAVLYAVLAWLVLRLARAGSPTRTALSGLIVIGIGFRYWTPRPLLFGLICMALTITIVERRRTTWWLVPVVWLWVQSHGSFPLGLAWLGARALGEALDWKSWPREAISYIGAFVAGLVVSFVNPLRGRLLTFPLTLGDKRDVFERIVEWTSPDFQRGSARLALVFLVLALLLLVRARLQWRDVVPVVAFIAAGLLASRNLPVTAIVLAPVLGRTLRRPESAPARRAELAHEQRINRALALTLAAAFVLFGASVFGNSGLRLNGYPVASATYLDEQGLLDGSQRIVHRDFVGNYLQLRYGRRVPVFIDDRYDMYPVKVSKDYIELLEAGSRSLQILDDRRVDIVLWDKDHPLTNLLLVSGRWYEDRVDDDWVILRRRT